MNFLEKDLEQIIWESDNEKLLQKRLPIEGKKYRQLRLGNYGVLDLMTVFKSWYFCSSNRAYTPYLNITVYELKKEKVGISAFLQAVKYCKAIKTFLEEKKPGINFKLNICLVAKEVDTNSDFIYLVDLLNNKCMPANNSIISVSAYSFYYDIDGIVFKNHSEYNLIHKGF